MGLEFKFDDFAFFHPKQEVPNGAQILEILGRGTS